MHRVLHAIDLWPLAIFGIVLTFFSVQIRTESELNRQSHQSVFFETCFLTSAPGVGHQCVVAQATVTLTDKVKEPLAQRS